MLLYGEKYPDPFPTYSHRPENWKLQGLVKNREPLFIPLLDRLSRGWLPIVDVGSVRLVGPGCLDTDSSETSFPVKTQETESSSVRIHELDH